MLGLEGAMMTNMYPQGELSLGENRSVYSFGKYFDFCVYFM